MVSPLVISYNGRLMVLEISSLDGLIPMVPVETYMNISYLILIDYLEADFVALLPDENLTYTCLSLP